MQNNITQSMQKVIQYAEDFTPPVAMKHCIANKNTQ